MARALSGDRWCGAAGPDPDDDFKADAAANPQAEFVSGLPDEGTMLPHPIAAQPPRPAATLIAGVLQPAVALGVLLLCLLWREQPFGEHLRTLSVLVVLLTFPGANRFRQRPLRAALGVLKAWSLSLAALGAIVFWIPSLQDVDASAFALWAVLTPIVQWLLVLLGRRAILWRADQPGAARPALIIGGGDLAARVGRVIEARREFGQRLVGFVEDRQPQRRAYQTIGRVVGSFDDAVECIRRYRIRDVYITLPLGQQARFLSLLERLRNTGVSVFYVPDVFGIPVMHGRLRTVGGLPMVGLLESPFVGVNGLIKRISDLVLSSIILVLISPLMLILAIGVRLSSPGPVIFKQRRNGVDGKEIVVYKFRSMRAMDDGSVVRQATRNDSRVTPFGAFLRRSSFDELPQFFNVLQGHMSIVGPRPHAVAHNEEYRRIIDTYMLRHKIKPGITGWAQVHGHRGETDQVEKMVARVACDIEYLRNWSFTLDLRIILRTIWLVLFDRSAY